ncbi:hypothetical protein LguiB_004274 [Lonicera macranthoides]
MGSIANDIEIEVLKNVKNGGDVEDKDKDVATFGDLEYKDRSKEERAIGVMVEAWDLVTDFFIPEEVLISIKEWDNVKGELSLVEFIYSHPNEFRECLKKGIPKQARSQV